MTFAFCEYSYDGTDYMGLALSDPSLCIIALREGNCTLLDLVIKMSMTHWTPIDTPYTWLKWHE